MGYNTGTLEELTPEQMEQYEAIIEAADDEQDEEKAAKLIRTCDFHVLMVQNDVGQFLSDYLIDTVCAWNAAPAIRERDGMITDEQLRECERLSKNV